MAKSTHKAPKHTAQNPVQRGGGEAPRRARDASGLGTDGSTLTNCPQVKMPLSNIIFCLATAVVVTAQSDGEASAQSERELDFTTLDGLYHQESFYELTFSFICP